MHGDGALLFSFFRGDKTFELNMSFRVCARFRSAAVRFLNLCGTCMFFRQGVANIGGKSGRRTEMTFLQKVTPSSGL
jgi:hypothetical protein